MTRRSPTKYRLWLIQDHCGYYNCSESKRRTIWPSPFLEVKKHSDCYLFHLLPQNTPRLCSQLHIKDAKEAKSRHLKSRNLKLVLLWLVIRILIGSYFAIHFRDHWMVPKLCKTIKKVYQLWGLEAFLCVTGCLQEKMARHWVLDNNKTNHPVVNWNISATVQVFFF